MNPKAFGRLVKALRKEHHDEQGKVWTQAVLADKACLSRRMIERIEGGTFSHLDTTVVRKLADALRLTAGERHEFFLAAMDVDKLTAPPLPLYDHVESHLCARLATMPFPGFVCDPYMNLIAANQMFITLFNIIRLPNGDTSTRHNLIRMLFEPRSLFRSLPNDEWQDVVITSLRLFRMLSLRYRASPMFRNMVTTLRNYPDFQFCWEQTQLTATAYHGEDNEYRYCHPVLGPLHYATIRVGMPSTQHTLWMVSCVPLTEGTARAFATLRNIVVLPQRWEEAAGIPDYYYYSY